MRRLCALPVVLLATALPFIQLLVAQPPLPKAEVKQGKKIAVLVGVNGYADVKFPNLKYAEQDMLDLKTKLEKAGFTVILLLGSAKGDEEASRTNIVDVLIDKREGNKRFAFRDVTDVEDQILVAFSGHGEQIIVEEEDDDGKKAKREVPFFAPKRAESGKPSTQVSLNDVLKTFNGGKAKALLLVDACRSFADNREGTKGAVIDRKRVDALRPNVGGMFAASDRQAARESDKVGHGLFFSAVLTAMDDERSQDKSGNVVWSRMVDEIADVVKARSPELFPSLGKVEHQVPQPFGAFTDKFVLARADASPEEPIPPTKGKEPQPPPAPSGLGTVTLKTSTTGYVDIDSGRKVKHPTHSVLKVDTVARNVIEIDNKQGMFLIELNGSKVWVRQDCCDPIIK